MASFTRVIQFVSVSFLLLPVLLHLSACCINGAAADLSTALFAFGGSYADTGNHNRSDTEPRMSASWSKPYGETWPGSPAGRFSDGNVSTDFIAAFLGIPSPPPYGQVMTNPDISTTNGVNFAYGGAGVFNTFYATIPNVSTQIAQFQNLTMEGRINWLTQENGTYSSLAFTIIGGNDYGEFDAEYPNATKEEKWAFVPVVVNALADTLRALYDLGFRKIAVSNLLPLGCQPGAASHASSGELCDEDENRMSQFHNDLLAAHVYELKKLPGAEIIILDLYSALTAALNDIGTTEPCCQGISSDYECADVASNGTSLYTVCSDPSQALLLG
ncbi:hypothetical protein GOP47_0002037 [Adiantum capillus-veneris]|uniref:GDSL esterase/lipase n=1 Tax=Adiantum capillus-veneris TaxID=13818 RepID=A0A9D4VA40_ADICA|nr:hypothetical protein GOP47_0002037 [Adiantum capillus-veneris]